MNLNFPCFPPICFGRLNDCAMIGERAGNLTVVTRTPEQAQHVLSQLEILQRSEISNPPAYGSRIVDLVLNDKQLYAEWNDNLGTMSGRIIEMRKRLFDKLQQLQTPGTWNHIVDQIFMAWRLGVCGSETMKYYIFILIRMYVCVCMWLNSRSSQGPQGTIPYLHD